MSKEASVTMTEEQWKSVLDSFEALPYPEDWTDKGNLVDEEDELIRQKLVTAAGR